MTRLGEISIGSKVIKGNASVRRGYDERRLEREIERYLRRARVRGAVKNKNSITNDKPNSHIFFTLYARLCKCRAGNGI